MDGYVHPDFAPVSERVRAMLEKRSATGGIAVVAYHHGRPNQKGKGLIFTITALRAACATA